LSVLVCDFGGVLTTPLEHAFRFWSEESGVPLEHLGNALAARAERDGDHPLFRLERGEITETDFLDGIAADLGAGVDMTGFSEAYFSHLGANEELLGWLGERRARGLRLALCTNNVREWEPRWRAMLPVDELFDVVVDSAFVGTRKPERRIYEIVLERLGDVAAEDCVLLDDLEVNCDGARAVGLGAVQFESNAKAIPELERALGEAWSSGPR
jgi:epoxide hydrolase-like predicted phosphatase